MEYSRILTCKAMTTDEIWVRILINNDCGTEKFLNVFFPVELSVRLSVLCWYAAKNDNDLLNPSEFKFYYITSLPDYAF